MSSETLAFTVDEKGIATVSDNKLFELLVIAGLAANFSQKMLEINKQGAKGIGGFVGYYKHMLSGVGSFASDHGIELAGDDIQAILSRIEANIETAYSNTQKNTSKIRVSDYAKESWDFFSELVFLTMDSVRVISDRHKPIKGSDDEYDHNTRFQFSHDQHHWVFNVRTKGRETPVVKGFIDGKEVKVLDEPMTLIFFLLYKVSWVMALDYAYDHIIRQLARNKELVGIANKISNVIGGDAGRYIAAAFNFKYLQSASDMSAGDAVVQVFTEQVRCDQNELQRLKAALA